MRGVDRSRRRSVSVFSRSRRWQTLAAGAFISFALLGLGALAAANTGAASPRRQSRSVRVGPGETIKRFDLSEPAGVIRLLRIVVPRGTRADMTGVIPQVAGVSISTPSSTIGSETCRRSGEVDVCTQSEEACPMPAAIWHFQLHKLAGPAGVVRLEFVVG